MKVTLRLEGLKFYGHHGVTDEEQEKGQNYLVNLNFDVECTINAGDDIADTVDYANVSELIVRIGTFHRFRTLERFAQVLAEEILQLDMRIKGGEIAIYKPSPPVSEQLDAFVVALKF